MTRATSVASVRKPNSVDEPDLLPPAYGVGNTELTLVVRAEAL